MADVLLSRESAGLESYRSRRLKINGCVTSQGKDIVSILEHFGAIWSGERLVWLADLHGTMEYHFGLCMFAGKDPSNVATQRDVWESIESRVDNNHGQQFSLAILALVTLICDYANAYMCCRL